MTTLTVLGCIAAEFLGCTELSLRRVVLTARNKRRYQKKRGSAA